MEDEKKVFLCSIVESDFTAGNESRLAYVEAMDDNAFVLHFRANSAEGLKGIKLKAGYQFNGETKDWTEEVNAEEGSILPTAVVYHKDLFVKMTGAKRGKTLLAMNNAFGAVQPTVKGGEENKEAAKEEEVEKPNEEARIDTFTSFVPKAEEARKGKEVEEEEDFHFVIPEEVLDHSGNEDAVKRETLKEEREERKEEHRPRDVEEMPIVKPSLGEDYEKIPSADIEARIKADEKANEVAHDVEEKGVVVQEEATKPTVQEKGEDDDAARGFVLDFIMAIGKAKKFADIASVLAKMTESQWKVVQILMKTGAVKFAEWVSKALYDNAKERKWGLVARVDAPTYKDLKDGVSGACVDASDAEADKGNERVVEEKKPTPKKQAESTVSVEQKPDVTVRTNFEDEDHEALNPHGRIRDLKGTMSRCSGFLPRSSVSISPDGDFEERW